VKKSVIRALGLGVAVFGLATALFSAAQSEPSDKPSAPKSFIVEGRTQCIPQCRGIVAPTVLHPVVEVKVSVGDVVKKDQPIVQLDDDEPKADVRHKKALLEVAGIQLKEAKRYRDSLEALHSQGAIPEQRIHDARAQAHKAEADERVAKAAVDVAEAELEHYLITAPIAGVVNRLEVNPGMVSRPGTTVWGEILDIKELDVRCQLTFDQVEIVKTGDEVEVLGRDGVKSHGHGRIVFIGLSANKDTDKVPVLVRVANPDAKLRCEIPVQVRFFPPAKKQ